MGDAAETFMTTEAFAKQFEPLLSLPIPREVNLHLRRLVSDTIAIADHARRHALGACEIDDIDNDQGGEAEVWGTTRRTNPMAAAFLNGNAAESLDFQEVLISGRNNGHSAVVVVPTLTALASLHPDSEEKLLRAFWIAFCANYYLCQALGRGHRERGPAFRTTSITSPVAAALAGGFLLGDVNVAANACAIAAASLPAGLLAPVSSAAGSFSVDKDLSVGFSARHATTAALLAAKGATGSQAALAGPASWLASYGFDTADGTLLYGDPATLDMSVYALKFYPTSYGCQCAVSLAIEAVQTIDSDDIETIDLHIKTSSVLEAVKGKLTTHISARFSIRYAVATALLRKRCALQDFDEASIHHPKVQALMDKINLCDTPEFEHIYEESGVFPCRLVLTTKSGETFQKQRMSPAEGYSDERLEQVIESKIESLCEPRIAQRILELTRKEEADNDVLYIQKIYSEKGGK